MFRKPSTPKSVYISVVGLIFNSGGGCIFNVKKMSISHYEFTTDHKYIHISSKAIRLKIQTISKSPPTFTDVCHILFLKRALSCFVVEIQAQEQDFFLYLQY